MGEDKLLEDKIYLPWNWFSSQNAVIQNGQEKDNAALCIWDIFSKVQ